jgi:hypothetical protein
VDGGKGGFDFIGRGPVAADFFNVDAVENWCRGFWSTARLRSGVSGLPPHSPFFEDGLGLAACLPVLGLVRQLLVATQNDDARPMVVTKDFVRFNTDKGIRAHPFDFLSECGKTVQAVGLKRKVDGNNVRLIIARASQPAGAKAGKQVAALLRVHLAD